MIRMEFGLGRWPANDMFNAANAVQGSFFSEEAALFQFKKMTSIAGGILVALAIGPNASVAQPARAKAPAGACFVSDPDSKGATAQERAFRGAIRRSLEQKAGTGLDGTVTVRFETFRISPGRAADVIDRVNYRPDLTKPIYTVRTQFETCTDYRTATTTKQLERNFACFTESTGGQNCMASGTVAGMRRETSQYVPK
jgi:hypothetical protein